MRNLMMCNRDFPAYKVSRSLFGSDNPIDFLESILGSDPFFEGSFRTPAVDVRENESSFTIIAELPGLTEKDLKLEVKERVLSLSVEREEKTESKPTDQDKDAWIRRERRDFAFARSFSLPENVDVEAISARFKDGLLTVELPKKPEAAPRRVTVNAA